MEIAEGDTCAFGDITLGQTDSFGVEWYFTDLDGWGATPSTVQATQKASGDGGFASPAFATPRTFTASGAVVADTRADLIGALDRLEASAKLSEHKVTITTGGAERYTIAQRQDEINPSHQGDRAAEFTITWLAEDPRKLASDLTASTMLPSSSGGLIVPFTVPFVVSGVQVSGRCVLTNPGKAVGPVIARIDGPCSGVTSVTHVGLAQTLKFAEDLTLSSDEWLIIDMDNHRVLANASLVNGAWEGPERNGYVTRRGWSGFSPGQNIWAFASEGADQGAMLTITATPAW